jgi:subfamily B ATP-binding cassette protein MsbA
MKLLEITGKPAWATPVLIVLGFASSLAETIGISLILLFVYSVTGHVGGPGNGIVPTLLSYISDWLGGSTWLALLIFFTILARACLGMTYERISAKIGDQITETVRNLIHAQYLTMPYDELQLSEPSHLMHILGTESWHVASAYKSFTRLIVNFCSITIFAIFLTFLSWKIMAVSVAGTLILSFILRWLRKPAQELGQKFQLAHDKLGLAMVKTLYGMRTIRAYGQEAAQQQNFIKVSENAKVISNAQTRLATLIGPLTEAGYLAILCAIIEFSRWTNTSFAVTLAAFALLYRLQPHSREFEDNLLNLAQLQAQLREVRDTLESVGIASPDANAINIQNIKRDITFENVSLRYAGNLGYALENVSFSISAGNVTAIIGQSGAGKTTIINLLLRLYDPTEGRILVDGVDLQNIRREDWLGLIGAAGQDVDLVEGSIKENIGMAKIGCSDDGRPTGRRRRICRTP